MKLFHGTSAKIARKILRQRHLKPDSWLTSSKRWAHYYAKKNKRGRIISIEVDVNELTQFGDMFYSENGVRI